MKWITNTTKNPTKVKRSTDKTPQESLTDIKQWQSQYIVGPPKATDVFTVQQLLEMDIVGLYQPDE